MMSKFSSVSISRPGEVPKAEPMYVIKKPPSGLARTSSAMEERIARLLFLNLGR
jgi:hypothetical protein